MLRYGVFLLLLDFFTRTRITEAANILALYPFPSVSHQSVVKPILNELASRGHNVVYYSTLPCKDMHPNVTFREIKDMILLEFADEDPLISKLSPIFHAIEFYEYQLVFARNFFKSPEIKNLIHSNENFDVVMYEPYISSEFTAPFIHKFNALGIVYTGGAHSSWLSENAGLPDNPSYMVDGRGMTADRLNLYERIVNTFNLWATTAVSYYYLNKMEEIVNEFVNYTGWESRPHLRELIVDNALVLVNTHHSLGSNYPLSPHVKEMGGIHVAPTKPLPKELAEFLDGANEGFIYFSLGSVTNTQHKSILNFIQNHLIKALGSVKLKVLCKLHKDPSFVVPKNVMISQWVPQQDVLGHKNIKLFISHGGYQSTIEAAHRGVPMLVIPIFCDQFKNGEQIVAGGFGKLVDMETVTTSSLLATINEIINNPSYKTEAMKKSNQLKDRPLSPLNESIFWIEYVLKHGKVLQPASLRLSFVQLHQLDVLATVTAVLVILFVGVTRILRFILSCWRKNSYSFPQSKKTQ